MHLRRPLVRGWIGSGEAVLRIGDGNASRDIGTLTFGRARAFSRPPWWVFFEDECDEEEEEEGNEDKGIFKGGQVNSDAAGLAAVSLWSGRIRDEACGLNLAGEVLGEKL